MREIKFRVWDKEMKCMVKVDSMHFPLGKSNEKDIAIFNEEEFYFQWVHDYNLMQYTGLKDKNGVEIYEGDIIKTDDFYEGGKLVFKGKIEVIKSLDYYINRCAFIDTSGEVIGNIYENPELLEKIK